MRTSRPLMLALAVSIGLVACKSDEQHLDVTVSWDDTKQTIDGFGASSAFFGDAITDEVADQLFDAKKGIGLSLLRIMIGVPDDTMSDGSEPTEDAKPVATAPELTTAQQAITRGARVWATAWTPPPIWKTTNNKNGSGEGFESNTLKPEHYQDYANYLADFVDLVKQEKVDLFALSPINEPDYTATWDNAQFTPDELAKLIGENVGPTFKERCPSVKIAAPDTADWPSVDEYLTPLLAQAKEYVSVVATHPYQNSSAKIVLDYKRPAENGMPFWQTEWSQENMNGDTPDPSMTSAIGMMKKLHDHMVVSNLNAWNWWAIYISPDALKGADEKKVRQNPALIQPDANLDKSYMFKRGFALGNWSKFVRPGFKRVGATDKPTGGVLIEAYRDEADHLALIAINTGSKTVTQNFFIEGHSFGTLTPWVTSADDDLAAKSSFDGADSFTYDLPGKSVVTFVNWDATSETPNQGTLPVLKYDAGTDAKTSTGGLDCSAAMVPDNLVEGGVTDFSDWKSSKWGNTSGLWGYMYSYKGPSGSTMSAGADADAKEMHVTGEVMAGDYGGAGLSFGVCTTVTSFAQVEFTLSGSSPGCDLELQIKTFDQQPLQQNPAGGCDQDTQSCYNFPVAKKVAVPTDEPTTVVVQLSDVSNWSEENAAQVVGLQWQWTGNADLDPDAGVGCPIDVTISDIRFTKSEEPDAGEADAAEEAPDAEAADAAEEAPDAGMEEDALPESPDAALED
jgi:glucuronoarabinoxylan endo-1,4-beta-xylanase